MVGKYSKSALRAAYSPPQTIMSVPVQTAEWFCMPVETLDRFVVSQGVSCQVSVDRSYRPPVARRPGMTDQPPQTIISLPVQTAVCWTLPYLWPTVEVGVHELVCGLYLPPVKTGTASVVPGTAS